MYDDGSSEGGPKGSFENFKAEGDVLFKQGEYKKALESYNTALELRPGDKNCLVARSQCYLQLGDATKALTDADETLKEDKNYIRGLLQKAEALYLKGDFEFALVFYHRGHKLRPEVQGFKLGIQKCQEAIDNSIGDTAGIQLENKGDLQFFYEEQQKGKKQRGQSRAGYRKPSARSDDKKDKKRPRTSQRDPKTVKELLGELYADKEYLEKLVQEIGQSERKTEHWEQCEGLASDCLEYLDSRTDFWQQQKPMYARKRDKKIREGTKSREGSAANKDPTKWVLKNLEEIDNAQANGEYEKSLKQSKKVLKVVEKWSEEDMQNRPEVVANLHSCIGNAYLEMGEYNKSLNHHEVDLEIATQKNLVDAKSRALDNLGRVYARMGKFDKAIEIWDEKLPMSKSALERTWLFHEIGRCHLELGKFDTAKEYGEKSQKEAEEADDKVWQLNASVLIAQSLVKLEELQAGLEEFEVALDLAKAQDDDAAVSAIKKAIEDVNNRIVKGIKDGKEEDKAISDDDEKDDDRGKQQQQQQQKEQEQQQQQQKEQKQDKDDQGKRADCKYRVRVYTGDVKGAGSDSNVYLTIFGDKGDSGKKEIDNKDDNFEQGKMDEFTIECKDVGKISKLRIGHDNAGFSSGWHLDKVVIDNVEQKHTYEFPCSRWLATDEDDKKIERDLLCKDDDKKDDNKKPDKDKDDDKKE